MEEIDRDLPLEIASIASENSVEKLAVVSSIGADPGSSNYYLRIKGRNGKRFDETEFQNISNTEAIYSAWSERMKDAG